MGEVFGSTQEVAENHEYSEQEIGTKIQQAGVRFGEKIRSMDVSDPEFQELRQTLQDTGFSNSIEGAK